MYPKLASSRSKDNKQKEIYDCSEGFINHIARLLHTIMEISSSSKFYMIFHMNTTVYEENLRSLQLILIAGHTFFDNVALTAVKKTFSISHNNIYLKSSFWYALSVVLSAVSRI